MAWTYSTNYMGPAGLWWYEENNIPYMEVTTYSKIFDEETTVKVYEQYAGGRIDCRCDDESDPDYSHYGDELGVPILPASEWNKLSDWCDNLVTDSLLTWEELAKRYEEDTGEKLHPFCEESVDV